MNKPNKLSVIFNIETGEGRLVSLLLVYSFFIGFARLLVSTTAGTLLRDRYGEQAAQLLPYVYIGSAIAAPLVGYLYSKLENRLSFSRLLAVTFGFILVFLGLFYLVFLWLPEARWPAIAFYIWYYVLYALIMLAFWGLAGRLFDLRQSKRLFGLIGSGMVVAMIISGFLVRPLVGLIGTSNLLLLAAGGITGCLFLMLYITQAYRTDQPAEESKEIKRPQQQKGYTDLIKNRYVLLMVAVTTLNLVAYFFIDNAFYDRVYLQFPEQNELAGFLGEFLAIASLLNLGSRVFASGKLITRYGLVAGLLVLPIVLTVGAASVALVGTLFGTLALIFWLVVATRLLFRVVGGAIDQSAFSTLYQAMPTRQRLQAQTLIISVIQPVAGGVAGVLLLFLSFDAVQISYALLFILAGWIVVVILVSQEYKGVLLQSLSKNKLGEIALSMLDKSSMAILEQQVKSPHPGVVTYTLNILEKVGHESLPHFLREVLSHNDPSIRQDALHRIERLGLTSMLAEVRLRAQYETSIPVRAVALRTMAELGETDALDEVAPYLEDANPHLRMGATVGLLRSGGIEGILLAGEKLIKEVDSPDTIERKFAAHVLGEVGQPSFYRPLLKLLQDDDVEVRRQALIAAGKLKNPKLWPLVFDNIAPPQLRTTAISAMKAGGESVIPLFETIFADAEQPTDMLIRVARICGHIQGDSALALLREQLDYPDNDVRHQVLASLSRCGYRAQGNQVTLIELKIKAELENAAWILATLVDIGDDESTSLLKQALTDELKQTQARTFLFLSFIYDSQTILNARDNLNHNSREKRAYALEVIDNTLTTRDLKVGFLSLLEDNLTVAEQLERLNPFLTTQDASMGCHRRLHQVIARPTEWISPWGRACALQAMAHLVEQEAVDPQAAEESIEALISALSDPESLLRETAAWTLFRLDPTAYREKISELYHDPTPFVAKVAQQLAAAENGELTMHSTIEKVIVLKSISIFAETPEEILATIAANLEELDIEAEETIIHKGDIGQSMYIITSGQVRIHDEEQIFGYLDRREIFGELSALDTEPRSASVTAVEETSLFRLDQDVLYELMADHVEVARGIIQVLTRLLRELIQAESKGVLSDKKKTAPFRKDVLLDGILEKLEKE